MLNMSIMSYHPSNTNAGKLYRKLGFVETGEIADDGEIIHKLLILFAHLIFKTHWRKI